MQRSESKPTETSLFHDYVPLLACPSQRITSLEEVWKPRRFSLSAGQTTGHLFLSYLYVAIKVDPDFLPILSHTPTFFFIPTLSRLRQLSSFLSNGYLRIPQLPQAHMSKLQGTRLVSRLQSTSYLWSCGIQKSKRLDKHWPALPVFWGIWFH